MSKIKKIISGLLIVATLLPCFALIASAKNVCEEISGETDVDGGVNTIFYVSAKDKKQHYVKMKMTRGKLEEYNGGWSRKIYDYYEVLVYGKQGNGEYKQISKMNIKNEDDKRIYFKGYTEYKIKIYSWKVDTLNKVGKHIMSPLPGPWSGPMQAKWDSRNLPGWRIVKTSGVTLCR